MKFGRISAVAVAAVTAAGLAACGSGTPGGTSGGGAGATSASGETVKVGIKFDQPGLGLKQGSDYTGFDVDVANYIAKELGYTPQFVEAISAQRETLIKSGQVKYIVGTYSITDKRKVDVDFAGPYFIAGQDLLVRADDTAITGKDALNGKKLCSVKGSTSAANIKKDVPGVNLQEYGTYTLCVDALKAGSVDALTTDNTILAGYAAQDANKGKLKVVGKTFSTENYGVGLKKGDKDMCTKVTAALAKFVSSGEWQKSVDKNLGPANFKPGCRVRTRAPGIPPLADHLLTDLLPSGGHAPAHLRRDHHMGELFAEYNIFAAFGMTILLTFFAAIGSLVLGTIIAIMRVSPVALFQKAGAFYVNTVRNTPLTLIIIACNIVLIVNLGFSFSEDFARDNIIWSIIGLSVYHAAFVCEALRSGVNTVPQGQAEAARSIGLTFGQSLIGVLLPQAFRGAITPLGNTLIALTKNTTVATAIGVAEVSGLMKEMQDARSDLILPIFLVVAIGFVILTLPVGLLTTYLSNRLAVKR